MRPQIQLAGRIVALLALTTAMPQAAAEAPKRGGTLTYMIAADAPPSFDAHRELTFATVYSGAPFYSVLIRVNPENPGSTTDFVCDLCTEMPQPTDDGRTYTFKIRDGVKFHDGSPLTANDVVASWNKLIFPPDGVTSARQSHYLMVDKVEVVDPTTVVFRLKFATAAFLPALADPFNWIYKKDILERDPRWYEKNVLGSGPFKFSAYETGQSIAGVRNTDYYHPGLPYLDGFVGVYAPKQAVRVDAMRSDRAAIDFRNLPPAARDELVAALGDKIAVQESDLNCGNMVTPNQKRKPFDDVRVRRALTLAVDRWNSAPALAKIAVVRTVGGVVFPGSPLAGTTEELWFMDWEFGGTPYANRALYEKWSPLNFAQNWKTPILIVHSQLDYRVDLSEGYQAFTAAKVHGVPAKFLYFPDEGHWVLRPRNRRLWWGTVLDWIDQYLKPAPPPAGAR